MGTRIAAELVRKLDRLGRISDVRGELTRTFLSPAMRRANAQVAEWMREAGLETSVDASGNLIGRLAGPRSDSPTLVLGSHLDTVRNAGKYDGAVGVLLPVVALGELRRRGTILPFAVEVVGFSEEEGVRFSSAYLGSKGYCGRLTASDLTRRDEKEISVSAAMADWNKATGRKSPRASASDSRPGGWLGYYEVHIEQGPVLEREGLSVGVVSAIAGQSRFRLRWIGKAGHAGTTPMNLRRDALAGAAEFVLAAEALARKTVGLVVTVGQIAVQPGAANVIPGEAVHTLDVRHARDDARRTALRQLERLATAIARRRRLKLRWQRTQDNAATACSRELTALLGRSVKSVQGSCPSLVSGAGHDGVVVSTRMPIAMLFVRCREGLSHHPDEFASPRDLDVALRVTLEFLAALARQHS